MPLGYDIEYSKISFLAMMESAQDADLPIQKWLLKAKYEVRKMNANQLLEMMEDVIEDDEVTLNEKRKKAEKKIRKEKQR